MVIEDYFYEKFIKNPEKGTDRIFNFLSKINHPQTKLKNIHTNVHHHPKVQEWMLKTYGKEI